MIHHLVINSADWFHLLSVCTCASIKGSRANHTGDIISGRVWQGRVQMSAVFIFHDLTLQLLVQYFKTNAFGQLILLLDHLQYILFPCRSLFTGSLLSREQFSRCCTLIDWLNIYVPARALRSKQSGLLNGLKVNKKKADKCFFFFLLRAPTL